MEISDDVENNDNKHIQFSSLKVTENDTNEGKIYLEKDVLHGISYIDEYSTHHMKIGWTDIIAGKFSEINSTCVLKFKHDWFKKTDNRK